MTFISNLTVTGRAAWAPAAIREPTSPAQPSPGVSYAVEGRICHVGQLLPYPTDLWRSFGASDAPLENLAKPTPATSARCSRSTRCPASTAPSKRLNRPGFVRDLGLWL